MQIEGVNYEVDWTEFTKGASFFIPCLDAAKAGSAVRAVTNRMRFKILLKPCTEECIKGVRIWRV